MRRDKQYRLTMGLFIIYLFILTWIILFKLTLDFSQLDHLKSINLIPFGSSAIVNGRIALKEIVYNVIIFIPFGLYISMLASKWLFSKKVVSCLGFSFLLELLQFIFAIGSSDITDLIGNTLGGIMGIGIFYVFKKIFKNREGKIINIIALISTLAVAILLSLLIIINK